jgi:succinate dehydrogenase / fumarate reductase membrane anchor subunit
VTDTTASPAGDLATAPDGASAAAPATTSSNASAVTPIPTTDDRIEISRVTRGRMRPRGSRRETAAWFLMRITGLGLFVLALAHFSILHFIYDPAQQNAEFIATQRWNQFFWRAIDWALLMLVLFHSFLGMRTVFQDYIRGRRSRPIALGILYTVAVILFVLGTAVVLTLPSPNGQPV